MAIGHRPRPVLFPPAAERDAVAAVLLLRPAPVLPGARSPRNWQPGETVEQLMADNLLHGDAVPGVR